MFQRAIVMSPNNIWKAVEKDGENSYLTDKMSQTLTKSLNCLRASESDILQCLRTRSVSDIFSAISVRTYTLVVTNSLKMNTTKIIISAILCTYLPNNHICCNMTH